MTDPDQFAQSVASNEHLRTLAALMQQQGIDITFAQGETHGGIPYMVILVQGPFTEQSHDFARKLAEVFDQQRKANKDEAERG